MKRRADETKRGDGRDGIDPRMLELLSCPLTKGPLTFVPDKGELVSRLARLAYPVRDGIPIMLPSEARELSDDEAGR